MKIFTKSLLKKTFVTIVLEFHKHYPHVDSSSQVEIILGLVTKS